MSLLDALLMEPTPLQTPTAREFFVALRTDGVAGSGTESDPWDGSTVRGSWASCTIAIGSLFSISLSRTGKVVTATISPTPGVNPFSVADFITISGETTGAYNGEFEVKTIPTSATFTFELETAATPGNGAVTCRSVIATVTTAQPHGLANGDVVQIDSVGGPSAATFNWHFVVKGSETLSFKCALAGPVTAPQGSSIRLRKVLYRLDTVLAGLPADSTLNIGAGVFETQGTFAGTPVRDRQKIVGAGMGVTTLKLTPAAEVRHQTRITGMPLGKGRAFIT